MNDNLIDASDRQIEENLKAATDYRKPVYTKCERCPERCVVEGPHVRRFCQDCWDEHLERNP